MTSHLITLLKRESLVPLNLENQGHDYIISIMSNNRSWRECNKRKNNKYQAWFRIDQTFANIVLFYIINLVWNNQMNLEKKFKTNWRDIIIVILTIKKMKMIRKTVLIHQV